MTTVDLSGRGHFPNLHTVVHLVPGSVDVAYGDRRPIIAQWTWSRSDVDQSRSQWAWPMATVDLSGRGDVTNLHLIKNLVYLFLHYSGAFLAQKMGNCNSGNKSLSCR